MSFVTDTRTNKTVPNPKLEKLVKNSRENPDEGILDFTEKASLENEIPENVHANH